ncbi:MAG: DUF349 domain-containing protein [Oleiphilaceae bacterium]|nr:DUF349 domain-containing protein [Oleiphilaceae bacterium]
MAAFIQKFFKGRKASKPAKAAEPKPSTENVAPVRDLVQEQQQILATGPTSQQLENLALEGKASDIRLGAAELLTDRDALQRLQKAARGRDKGVYQIVRQKLQTIRGQEAEQDRKKALAQTVLRQIEEHAKSDNTQMYEARFDNLLKHWKDVEAFASSTESTAFRHAADHCRERIDGMRYEQAQERIHQLKADERHHTLLLMESTLAELKAQPAEQLASLSALDALQKTQENRWLEATRSTQVEKAEQQTYETLMQAIRAYLAAVQRFSNHAPEVDQILAEANESTPADNTWRDRVRELVQYIDWPDDFTAPLPLVQLNDALGAAVQAAAPAPTNTRQEEQVVKLKKTLNQLEQALEARQLKESRQLSKQAQQQHRALESRNGRPFQARMQLFNGQLRELQDWQGFATLPKQIALCEQMEYLAEQPLDPEIKATKIKELQNEWRSLGGSSDRDLWQRFKQASDRAYEPCKDYFSAKSGLKQVNLDKRNTLCDELEHLLRDTDWSVADWKAIEHIHRVAREEWKAAWPVEFRDNRLVQKRFDDLLRQIEAPLNAERDKNEAIKQSIVERAQGLVEHEPLGEAMGQAKALQSEWQSVGITRHRHDRKLWQAFRAACDSVFARRDAAKEEQHSQLRETNEKIETLLTRTGTIDARDTESEITAALAELGKAKAEPSSAALSERLRTEMARLTQLHQELAMRKQSEIWQERVRQRLNDQLQSEACPQAWQELARNYAAISARDLVIRAEILTTRQSPEAEQPRRMEIQVQRLAEGMSGTGSSGNLIQQMETLVAAWCLATAPAEMTESLVARMNDAIVDATL